MPKLPKGMFRRGRSYYVRVQVAKKRVWRSLGPDREEATRQLRALRRSEPAPACRTRIKDVLGRWLANYVATRRCERSHRLACRRAEMYLDPFLGLKLLERVTASDLREYRLWLERSFELAPQ